MKYSRELNCSNLFSIDYRFKDNIPHTNWVDDNIICSTRLYGLVDNFHLKYPSKPGLLRPWNTFIPLPRLCFSAVTPLQKKKIYNDDESLYTFWSAVSFALIAYLYSALQFPLQSDTYISEVVFVAKFVHFLHSFHCSHQILVFLLLQLSSLTTIFYSQKKKMIFNIIKQENYKFLVLTEYAIREKLLLLSSMPSIPLFFSCPLISSSSIPSILSSLCFPFSFFSCTSVFSFSDFG